MDLIFEYEVVGAVIWGGGDIETVRLSDKLAAGDCFFANHRWYRVKIAGYQSEGEARPKPRAVVERIRFEGDVV